MQNPQDDYSKKLYELEVAKLKRQGEAYTWTTQLFKKIGISAAIFIVGSGISGGLATISPILFLLGMAGVIASIAMVFKS